MNPTKLVILFSSRSSIVNDIGIPGSLGFGVGIAPAIPPELEALPGTFGINSENYGNYRVKADGSIMVWIPRFYYKITNDTAAPYYGNKIEIQSTKKYALPESAAADGFATSRSAYDGNQLKAGFFVDKYMWSLTGDTWSGSTQLTGIASSIKNGNPISSESATKKTDANNYAGSFSNCKSNSQSPADNYGGAFAAAKSRGSNFHVLTAFQQSALALLSLAHAQASSSTTNNAWYHATNNFPKGNNNYGADVNDAACTFSVCDDAYWASRNEARKTGSANSLAKTTHNGQLSGVADVNGNQWEIVMGMTSAGQISKTISAISREAEAVVTSNAHGLANGTQIFIQGTVSTEWNTKMQYYYYFVSDVTENTFKLKIPSTGAYLDASALSADYTSGFTAYTQSFYSLKSSIAAKDVTATNHFNATWILANMDNMNLLMPDNYNMKFGNSTNQVLSGATSGSGYLATSCGMPMAVNSVSSSGTNSFGQDYFYNWFTNLFCLIRSGRWDNSSSAGVWFAYLYNTSGSAYRIVSSRSGLYMS